MININGREFWESWATGKDQELHAPATIHLSGAQGI